MEIHPVGEQDGHIRKTVRGATSSKCSGELQWLEYTTHCYWFPAAIVTIHYMPLLLLLLLLLLLPLLLLLVLLLLVLLLMLLFVLHCTTNSIVVLVQIIPLIIIMTIIIIIVIIPENDFRSTVVIFHKIDLKSFNFDINI